MEISLKKYTSRHIRCYYKECGFYASINFKGGIFLWACQKQWSIYGGDFYGVFFQIIALIEI